MITSVTTILVLLALFFKGGPIIHGFATALLFGVFIGTYSSVYVASSIALALGISKEDLIPTPVEKEGEDQDAGADLRPIDRSCDPAVSSAGGYPTQSDR